MMATQTKQEDNRAYLGLGSNLGDRNEAILGSLQLLREAGVQIEQVSSFYKTEPMDAPGPWFLNAVVSISVSLSPMGLLELCEEIEQSMGRKTKGDLAPRIVDLDLLLYGDLCIATERLVIPHPRLAARRFVLEPLAEIAPDVEIPGLGAAAAVLLNICPDTSTLERLS